MSKKDTPILSVDLSCKKTQASDTLTSDGERTTYTGTYNGTVNIGDNAVTVELKLKADDQEALEKCAPLTVGVKRKMVLSLTNEDLDNHDLNEKDAGK